MSAANLDAYNLKQVPVGGLIREDVMKQIWDISRFPLPFTDMIGSASHKNERKTWTQDSLAEPSTQNKTVDGADPTTNDAGTPNGLRVGNHSQTSIKYVTVSTRAIESDTIGRSNELSYQVINRQNELKRDMEAQMLTNQPSVAGTDAVEGQSAGLDAWIRSNAIYADSGAAVADGGFNIATGLVDAHADVTAPAAISETHVRDVAELVYGEGGNPTTLMVVPKVARQFSEYLFTSSSRVATLTAETNQKGPAKAVGSINTFISDFGVSLDIIPNRLQQNTDYTNADNKGNVSTAFFIDPALLRQSFLHAPRVEPLGKTGLSEKRLMSADYTLICTTEKGLGSIVGIDNSKAGIP